MNKQEQQRLKRNEYNKLQRYKKRQEIGEVQWLKNQRGGFILMCIIDYDKFHDSLGFKDFDEQKLWDEQDKLFRETYMHSRNHEFLYIIYKKNLEYAIYLKTQESTPKNG